MQFYIVYIKEAHPTDGWQVGKNTQDGVEFKQPTSELERLDVAKTCVANLKLDLPCLLDGMDDKVNTAYAGWPDRLYVIDHEGTIGYAGARGPRGFDPEAWETGITEAIKKAPKPIAAGADAKPADVVKEAPKKDPNASGDGEKK